MNELIESIINKEYTKADQIFHEALNVIVSRKLNEAKKMYSAKMFSEQVSVDYDGMVHTASGEKLLPSVYKQRRSLAEGDVVPLGDKIETKSYNVHVGPKTGDPVVITHKDTDRKHRLSHTDAIMTIRKHGDNLNDEHIENLLYKGPGGKHGKPESMKEEAKKAAIRTLQEKVRAKNITPETIKAAQQHSDKTAKSENPTSPEQFLPKRMGKLLSMRRK